MDQAARVAFINSQVACMLAELEGMKAANAEDEKAGRLPTYYVHHFQALPDQYGLGHNTVVSYLQNY